MCHWCIECIYSVCKPSMESMFSRANKQQTPSPLHCRDSITYSGLWELRTLAFPLFFLCTVLLSPCTIGSLYIWVLASTPCSVPASSAPRHLVREGWMTKRRLKLHGGNGHYVGCHRIVSNNALARWVVKIAISYAVGLVVLGFWSERFHKGDSIS